MLQLINQFRLNNGLTPFQPNATLAAAAQNQANYMAANMVFSSHVGAGGSTPQSRAESAGYVGYVSENIVGGTGMSASSGLNWWINSPVHYNTLITSRYSEAGTAFATNGSENFFVLVVGRPSNAPPAPNTADDSPEPLFITPITLAQPGEDGSIVHVVQDGQALWSLAAHYEVPLRDLLLYNGLKENAFVQPGDRIIIRLADGQAPPPTPTPPLTHVVQDGQSLWSIALLYDIKLGDILWLNNLPEDAILQPGEEVVVRLAAGQAPPPTPTPILQHRVRSSETLWDIALTYGLTLDGLLALNPGLTADSILQIDQPIWVRTAPATATPTPPPTQSATLTAVPQRTATATPTAVQVAQVRATAVVTPVPAQSANTGGTSLGMIVLEITAVLVLVGIAIVWYLRQVA